MMKLICSRNFWILTLMGLSSGLPLSLTGGTLQAWLKSENVDLGTIGLFAFVGLPYTWKFLWSPILDRFSFKFLGRRRFWMLIAQLILVVLIFFTSLFNPYDHLKIVGFLAFLIAFFSATQDIALDAWRREQLSEREYAWGNGIHIAGYLFAMRIISGSIALILSDHISWASVYQIMSVFQCLGLVATLLSYEKSIEISPPKNLKEAFIDPFVDFFQKKGALLILSFILLYKIGDNMASHMSMPFYLDIGFTRTEVGGVTKIFGWAGIALGTLVGGYLLRFIDLYKGLFWFGVLQMTSTFGFSILAIIPKSIWGLTLVIIFENFTAGLGTAAFVTFIGLMTNKQFTATQFALLSSLMGVPRTIISAPTGYLAKWLGWFSFFALCTGIALLGLILIRKLRTLSND